MARWPYSAYIRRPSSPFNYRALNMKTSSPATVTPSGGLSAVISFLTVRRYFSNAVALATRRFQPKWKTRFPHATQITIPKSYHFPMCDNPQLVARTIAQWHTDHLLQHPDTTTND